MRQDPKVFETIEAYLRGKLTIEERISFERMLAADADLADLVRQHRQERRALELLVEQDLLAKMKGWENDYQAVPASMPAAPARTRSINLWRMGIAAAIALAFGAWWFFGRENVATDEKPVAAVEKPAAKKTTPNVRPTKPKPNVRTAPQKETPALVEEDENDAVAATEPTPPKVQAPVRPVDPTLQKDRDPLEDGLEPATAARGTANYPQLATMYYRDSDFPVQSSSGAKSGLESNLWDQAVSNYSSGDYADVITALKPALKLKPNDLRGKEMLAHALYKNRRYDEAAATFRELARVSDRTVSQRSEWALALTLLHRMPARQNELNRVLDTIEKTPGHTFAKQARELKGKL